jgi:hypothetical protein
VGKRIAWLAYIAADDSYTKPLVIIPRKILDTDFLLMELTSEKVQIESQSKNDIDIIIFKKWLVEIFIPVLKRRREIYGHRGTTVLILDNCTSHGIRRFHQLCAENNLVPLFLPPHSSNQLQPLDFSVFDLTKRLLIRVTRAAKLNIQTQHVAQVVCAFMATAVPVNILKSFRNSGIDLIGDENYLLYRVIPGLARCLLNPTCLQPISIPEEIEDEAVKTDMKKYCRLMFNLEEEENE